MALSLKRERIFVMNNPAAEKALSATTEVGRRVLMAQKIASRRAGRWQVFLKIIISLLVSAKISEDEENLGRSPNCSFLFRNECSSSNLDCFCFGCSSSWFFVVQIIFLMTGSWWPNMFGQLIDTSFWPFFLLLTWTDGRTKRHTFL